MLIAKLLQGLPDTDKELYEWLNQSGRKNRDKNGGLGKIFHKKTRYDFPIILTGPTQFGTHAASLESPLVTQAFDINDDAPSVKIKSIQRLYELSQLFKKGCPGQKANSNKQAICLALICRQLNPRHSVVDADLRYAKLALDELLVLFQENGELENRELKNVGNTTIGELIYLKKIALDERMSATVVSGKHVIRTGDTFINSNHSTQTVAVPQSSEQIEYDFYVQKDNIEARVAGIEVYCGTMMEFYIGPHQPSTRQKSSRKINGHVSILSDEVQFSPFRNIETLRSWADKGFPGAAKIDVACLYQGEDDFHHGNGGIRKDNGLAMRIDFDRAMLDVALPLIDTGYLTQTKRQAVYGKNYAIKVLNCVDGHGIHPDDLTNLPILPTVFNKKFLDQEWHQHYVPTNWWAHCEDIDEDLKKKIAALSVDPTYVVDKFGALLEKFIMPAEVHKRIADASIFNMEDHAKVLQREYIRKQRIRDGALKTHGFLQYMQNETECRAGLAEMMERFRKVCEKRSDIIPPESVKRLLKDYQANFEVFFSTIPKPVVAPDEKKDDKETRVATSVNQMLETMAQQGKPSDSSKVKKDQQYQHFTVVIKNFSLEQLKYLSQYMDDVQHNRVTCRYFNDIRNERINLLGGGNTDTWREMRHLVKEKILAKLSKPDVECERLLSQHSGRRYAFWGETAAHKKYVEKFPPPATEAVRKSPKIT